MASVCNKYNQVMLGLGKEPSLWPQCITSITRLVLNESMTSVCSEYNEGM